MLNESNFSKVWDHVTSWLAWNPQEEEYDINLIKKIAKVVYKFIAPREKLIIICVDHIPVKLVDSMEKFHAYKAENKTWLLFPVE